jgi:uncharacterized protein YcgI (DUF1989 family)
LQQAHVSTYDRLWSNLPFLRPLVTITQDSLAGYGVDALGGRVHDPLGTRCDPYVNRMLTGEDFDFHCHSNLVRAVLAHGLTEFDVHDVLNVFQCTGLNEDDQYFVQDCPGKPGDFLEFFAEIVARAVDLSGRRPAHSTVERRSARSDRGLPPLGVEVHRRDAGLLARWKPPRRAEYRNLHGLRALDWNADSPP